MDSDASNYQLFIQTQELENESFPPMCGILIDLVEIDWPDDFDLDTAPVPVLLEHASHVLRRFCHRLNSLHYTLRVAPSAGPDEEPQILITASEVGACVARLVGRARTKSLYRTEIWSIPDGPSNAPALAAIEGFEMFDRDTAFFDKAVALGAMRLTVEMSCLTLTLGCSDMTEATDWVKYALETAALPVRWAL